MQFFEAARPVCLAAAADLRYDSDKKLNSTHLKLCQTYLSPHSYIPTNISNYNYITL